MISITALTMSSCQQETDNSKTYLKPTDKFKTGDSAGAVISHYGPPVSITPGDDGIEYWNYSLSKTEESSTSVLLFFGSDCHTTASSSWVIPIKAGQVCFDPPKTPPETNKPVPFPRISDWKDTRLSDPDDPRRFWIALPLPYISHPMPFDWHPPIPWRNRPATGDTKKQNENDGHVHSDTQTPSTMP